MGFKLKDETTKPSGEHPDYSNGGANDLAARSDYSDLESESGQYYQPRKELEPVILSNTVSSTPKDNHGDGITKLIIAAVVIAILAGVGFYIKGLFKIVPLDKYVENLSRDEIEADFKTSLTKNDDLAAKLPIYQRGTSTFTVESNGEIGIIKKDGKPVGLSINEKGYSLYGVNIGMPDINVDSSLTYTSDECFEVINDYFSGSSIARFYYDEAQNTALVFQINQRSNKVVNINYFNDMSIVTNGLSFD